MTVIVVVIVMMMIMMVVVVDDKKNNKSNNALRARVVTRMGRDQRARVASLGLCRK
jgi:hypothetical protein